MTQALLSAVATLAVLFMMDRFAPLSVRAAGVGIMPWSNEAAVRRFDRSYGMFRFPRTLFICLASFAVFAYRLLPQLGGPIAVIIVVLCALWAGFSWRDIWRARAFANSTHPNEEAR